jgi:hypothetical protein
MRTAYNRGWIAYKSGIQFMQFSSRHWQDGWKAAQQMDVLALELQGLKCSLKN